MKRRQGDEAGFTLVEVLIGMAVMGILLAGLANVVTAGLRANADSSARVGSAESLRTAVNRLEYEARCASGATIGGSGASVLLTLPSQCSHATGSYTWCVVDGQLIRYAATTCTGSADVFVDDVTTATPFTLLTTTGLLPRLEIDLASNSTGRPSNGVSFSDVIALRNAARS